MLRAENIHYSYNHHAPLFEGLDCAIGSGEIVGLTGPSGCGKSTLGRILAGYIVPQSGKIQCEAHSLPKTGYSPVQMIFQHPELAVNPRWKIKKILEEGNNDYRDLLQSFAIYENWLERYPHELSGGELQRITLIRAMAPATRFLVADEITASLDPGTQALIWKAVMKWAKARHVGILAISHDTSLLNRICDRIDRTFQ